MKMGYRRITAAGMAAVLLFTGAGSGIPAYGAEASVDVDETMYVNLNFYGEVSKINVVKGVSMNGQTEFTDYGTYEDVINMSNNIVPVQEDGTLTWNLPEAQRERFYYKCTMDQGRVILPWDFDVSYKLNGVPVDGDKLAGASGLVEINVKAEPNDNTREYYRNNLMLMVAVPVDMSQCYSVEAEGSQTQNLGETTAVVFTALPGEDGDYTVRIGTDSFESIGVIMAMVPGTVADLEHIKDLKEAKDTWQDAGDELYDSLEQMAESVENMRDGVDQVRDGMNSAESAREKWSNSKDSILAGNDRTLAALTALSGQMETMVPYLQTAKDSAEVVHSSMNDIVNTLGDMQDPIRKLHTRLKNIENSAEGISGDLPELQETMLDLIALDTQLQASEDTLLANLALHKTSSKKAMRLYDEEEELEEEQSEELEEEEMDAGNRGAGGMDAGENSTSPGSGHSSSGGGSEQADKEGGAGGDTAGAGQEGGEEGGGEESGKGGSGTDGSADGSTAGAGQEDGKEDGGEESGKGGSGTDGSAGGSTAGAGQEDGKEDGGEKSGKGGSGTDGSAGGSTAGAGQEDAEGTGSGTDGAVTGRACAGNSVYASIERKDVPVVGSDISDSIVDIQTALGDKAAVLQKLSSRSKLLTDRMSNLMDDTSDSAKYSAEIVDNMDYLIEDLTALNDSLDVYYPDLQAALDDTRELVDRSTDALNSGIGTMTIVQNTLKDSSGDFDAAARDSLRGSMELLDKSLSILDSTSAMRQAGRTMKDTIDNELDKFDTNHRFLFMDPSAEKVSFTSDRNKPPKTLQIVMRTDEISLDDETPKTADAEAAGAKVSPLKRMWNVLVQMWRAVVSIFKNR